MSTVTDVAIIFPLEHDEVVRELNQWLEGQPGRFGTLKQVDGHGGGFKAHQWDMWSGAFNYLPIDEFLTALANIPLQRWGWTGEEDRAKTLVIVQTEHGDSFATLRVGEMYPWGT